MFAYRHRTDRVDLAFTDRLDGLSTGPWAGLNLGTSNGDDVDTVERNLALLAAAMGTTSGRLVRMRQHHGADVAVVTAADSAEPPGVDGLVTDERDVALLVRVADCVPVVLTDERAGVVGVAHAGRRGVELGVVGATADVMRQRGATEISAYIGPRACGRCYEVPAAMREEVAGIVPETWSTTSWGTPALDLAAGVTAQLERAGVVSHDIAEHGPACTIEEDGPYYSYRRQGVRSGRLGAIVRVMP